MVKAWIHSYHRAHTHFVSFIMSRLIMVRAWSIVTTKRTLILVVLSCQGSLWPGLGSIVTNERTLILVALSCQGSLWSGLGPW